MARVDHPVALSNEASFLKGQQRRRVGGRKGSAGVVVGDQRTHDRLAGAVVVPDRSGQGQQPLQDPDRDALDGPATIAEV
jgi:hypothetical protein